MDMDYNVSVQENLQRLAERLHDRQMQTESKQVLADPAAHKMTMIFKGNWNYRFYNAPNMRGGKAVRWCWSTKRNLAGYFLMWREVETEATVSRDHFAAHKVKQRLIERCHKKSTGVDMPTRRPTI